MSRIFRSVIFVGRIFAPYANAAGGSTTSILWEDSGIDVLLWEDGDEIQWEA